MSEILSHANFAAPPRGCAPGELIKISLPGESCWAEVVEVMNDRQLQVRIDNHVGKRPSDVLPAPDGAPEIGPLHQYKVNDVITVTWRSALGNPPRFYCDDYEKGLLE